MKQIGELIKKHKERKGWTSTELAERLGVSRMLIWYWENNRKIPGGENLVALMNLFKLTRKDFEQPEEKASEPVLEEAKK